jgi:cyclophilin family peptidyl-prolyl cis-trans isomerase
MFSRLPRPLPVLRAALLLLCAALAAPAIAQQAAPAPRAEIRTSLGSFLVELYPDKAPRTVETFLRRAREGSYDGTVFHRVLRDHFIQGGSHGSDLRRRPSSYRIPGEANNGLSNLRGTLSASRVLAEGQSADGEFFINVVDNPGLDFRSAEAPAQAGFTVFGRVVEGMEVVDRIRQVEVEARPRFGPGVPRTPVMIERVLVQD